MLGGEKTPRMFIIKRKRRRREEKEEEEDPEPEALKPSCSTKPFPERRNPLPPSPVDGSSSPLKIPEMGIHKANEEEE
jgi:hypothetical protein